MTDYERKNLRDRFAMAALTGLLANAKHGENAYEAHYWKLVKTAYELADAMLTCSERRVVPPPATP